MFVSKVSSAQYGLIRPGSGWGIPEIRSELAEPALANSGASAGAWVCREMQISACVINLYRIPFPRGSQKRRLFCFCVLCSRTQ